MNIGTSHWDEPPSYSGTIDLFFFRSFVVTTYYHETLALTSGGMFENKG